MAFLSGLFRETPSKDFAASAVLVVQRVLTSNAAVPSPDVEAFREALEKTSPITVTDPGATNGGLDELHAVTDLLTAKKYVPAIVQARDLMTREPDVLVSALNIIGAAYFELRFYREAVRHYAAAARFDAYFETMHKSLTEVHRVLRASPSCKLSRLVLAVLSTDAFDAAIDNAPTSRERAGALLARGEIARRLGAPHLALRDFAQAAGEGDHASTNAMIVLAAADLGDTDAEALVSEAERSAAFVELDTRLATVLPQWEAAAREEWGPVLKKLEARE